MQGKFRFFIFYLIWKYTWKFCGYSLQPRNEYQRREVGGPGSGHEHHKIFPIPLYRFRRNWEFLEVQSKEPHWSSIGRKWIKKKKSRRQGKEKKKKREGKSENGDPLAAPTTGNSSCPSSSISSSFSFLCPAKTLQQLPLFFLPLSFCSVNASFSMVSPAETCHFSH